MFKTGALTLAAVCFLSFNGCSPGASEPPSPSVPGGPEGLFADPQAFCFGASQTTDSLTVYNFGKNTLKWMTVHTPAGLSGLPSSFEIESSTGQFFVLDWVADDAVEDSIVAETRPVDQADSIASYRLVIPIARVSGDYIDIHPPVPPEWLTPEAESTYAEGDTIALWWSRSSDCSGIANYQVQVSSDPGFTQILCCDKKQKETTADIIIDPGDSGRAYCRVLARDVKGLTTVSETITWVVE